MLVQNFDFTTSFFESASGLTTTGITNLKNIEQLPHSLLLWRSLSQWLGGFGIIIFFISFLSYSNGNNKQLVMQETTFSKENFSLFDLKRYLKASSYIYIFLTIFCALSLKYFDVSFFDAICHACTTISTGGFSNYSIGPAYFNSRHVEIILMLFMFFGGINFLFLIRIFSQKGPEIIHNGEFLSYVGFICLGTIFFCIYTHWNYFLKALFCVISFISTTGFALDDFSNYPPLLLSLGMGLSFIGGCSGSTSGGFKLWRFLAIIKITLSQIEKIFHPNKIRSISVNNTLWHEQKQIEIFSFMALFLFILFVGTFLLQLFMPQLDCFSAFSTTLASLTNVGVNFTTETAIGNPFVHFSTPAKFLLTIEMLLGRLELYAILILFSNKFWRKFE